MECCICFSESFENILCSDTECNTVICHECFIQFVDFCKNEYNTIPKCQGCNLEYLYSNLLNLPESTRDTFDMVMFNYLVNFLRNEIAEKDNTKNFIIKVRREKLKHIEDNFPPVLKYVIKTALQKKLNRVFKTNGLVPKTLKKCPKITCISGRLDDEGTCNGCFTIFCLKCEKEEKDDHTCLQEDLDSVKVMSELIRCPQCHIPVTKMNGCNVTTCSYCKTKFSFITGKPTQYGNHANDSINLLKDKDYKLSMYLKFDPMQKEIIQQIEQHMPTNLKFERIIKHIEDKNYKKTSIYYNHYKLVQLNKRRFHKYYDTITENMTCPELLSILQKVQ